MVSLLTIDPGTVTGWALWEDKQLVACAATVEWDNLSAAHVTKLVIEIPTTRGRQQKAAGNDLISLAFKAGYLVRSVYCTSYETVTPVTWNKGNRKEITKTRSEKALSAAERARVVGDDHNMWDAIGIGLWVLKRSVV